MTKEEKRQAVIPGEIIASGDDYLPGEGTEKIGKNILSRIFGLAEETNKLVRVIPLSGVYEPRRGNVVIGRVENLTFNGWIIDIGSSIGGFLSLTEVPRFINKNDLAEIMDIGDMVVAKVWSVKRKGIDLTLKSKGLGKLEDGMIMKINSKKVPRVIGKEGSMVSMIKDETNCNITVGQNGFIWIKGNKIEDELLAKKAIIFVAERSFVHGLTDRVKDFFEKEKGGKNKNDN
jgi:exosome complex component RRP4